MRRSLSAPDVRIDTFKIETIKESDAFGLHSSRHQVDIILIETVEESDAYELVNAT